MVILPAEALIGLTAVFVPSKKREWFLAGCVGVIASHVIFALITETPWLINMMDWLRNGNFKEYFDELTKHTATYDYVYITLTAFTFFPSVVCFFGGVAIGLNPIILLVIVSIAKILKIYVMMLTIGYLWKQRLQRKKNKTIHE